MQNIYDSVSELEQIAKEQYAIPDYIMMEHAAEEIKSIIMRLSVIKEKISSGILPEILIVCGKGNNGGDGFALARLLQGKLFVTLLCPKEPTSPDAITQFKICKRLGIKIIDSLEDYNSKPQVVVDCIFGTGFHGNLPSETEELITKLNEIKAVKIACDIPSGMLFKADFTITMGSQKLQLYSDAAKNMCGKIVVADLGIFRTRFEEPVAQDLMDEDTISLMPFPTAYLVEKSDAKLPLRENKSAHKGNFGHVAVYAGEKSGAAILSATAAMNFGSGLTSLVKTEVTDLNQFKITPELMVANTLPEKTSCVLLGPGMGWTDDNPLPTEPVSELLDWFKNTPNPACVLDADIFRFVELQSLLEELNSVEGGKIILTPHLKEYELLVDKVPNVASYKNVTIVRKSANTFITSDGNMYVVADGTQNLAKGGSGDVLAGMIAALLAQGYSAKDAAITACEIHALASAEYGAENYDFSPEKLIELIKR